MNLSRLRTSLVLLTVVFLGAFGKAESAHAANGHKRPPPQVDVVVAHAQRVELTQTLVGRLAPTRIAEVRARVTGIVLKRTYDEGSMVKEGQQLFQIDPAPLRATLNLQEAALAQAQASAKNAEQTAVRDRKLNAKGLLSPQELDNALANKRTTEAAVKQAEANVELARLNLSYAKVTAPISGLTEEAQVTEGALVSQSAATVMTTVQQIDPLYINFTLPADQAARLRAATRADPRQKDLGKIHISLRDGTPYPQAGKLDFQGSSVDASTGSVSLRGIVTNPEERLLPGMFVNVTLVVGAIDNAFVLPQAAVQRDNKGAYVLTVNSDGKVGEARVKPHQLQGSHWVLTGQLKDGAQVIVSGVQKTRPGGTVKPHVMNSKNGTGSAASAQSS